MKRPPNLRLVIFDLDGVLVDTSPWHAAAFDELWRQLGVDGPPYATIAGYRTEESIAKFTAALEPSAADIDAWAEQKRRLAREIVAEAPIVFEDTREAIERLRRAGLRLAVGTAASPESARASLARLGAGNVFAPIVTAADVARGKPDPEVYLRAMRDAGVRPDEAVVIEDSRTGLAAAVASGAFTASVRTGEPSESPRFLGAFPDLASLARVLAPDDGNAP